jgi:hypothetical protein
MINAIDFISASTAGIVRCMFGYVPDIALLISNYDATNPNVYIWANSKFKGSGATTGWAAALSLLVTGSTGVVTRDTTGITAFGGGTTISATETNNSTTKHVNKAGVFATANDVTKSGLSIPADHQANSGRNLCIALKEDNGYFASITA